MAAEEVPGGGRGRGAGVLAGNLTSTVRYTCKAAFGQHPQAEVIRPKAMYNLSNRPNHTNETRMSALSSLLEGVSSLKDGKEAANGRAVLKPLLPLIFRNNCK